MTRPDSDSDGGRPLLELIGISKRFGAVSALSGVDFSLRAGEIHALLGENGAGKSTLMHIAFGMIAPDQGEIRILGKAATLPSPRAARAHRIGMVHQHFTTIEALTVKENLELAIGRRARSGDFSWDTGFLTGLSPSMQVGQLGVAPRQRLEVAKALALGAEVLLLDEPTAVLAPSEVEEMVRQIREFADRGGAVAFITHKLPEVFAAADRVTVLRHGNVTLHGRLRDHTEGSLAQAMIGATVPARSPGPEKSAAALGETGLELGGLPIRAGELVGVVAVEGQGQRELFRKLARFPGAAFVPEDRTTEGLVPEMSLTENLLLGRDRDSSWRRGPWLSWKRARVESGRVLSEYRVVAENPGVKARALSGGNQQKLILARALESRPRVLLVENPFRGLDLRATEEIAERLRAAGHAGIAVVAYSTDLDEVLDLADRILVIREGKVQEAPPGSDRAAVGRLMLGLTRE